MEEIVLGLHGSKKKLKSIVLKSVTGWSMVGVLVNQACSIWKKSLVVAKTNVLPHLVKTL